MAAYAISEVEIYDEQQAARHRELAAASIAQCGGRVVIVEFPSMARLREWYASPEYAPALAIRRRALGRRLLFVEGVA